MKGGVPGRAAGHCRSSGPRCHGTTEAPGGNPQSVRGSENAEPGSIRHHFQEWGRGGGGTMGGEGRGKYVALSDSRHTICDLCGRQPNARGVARWAARGRCTCKTFPFLPVRFRREIRPRRGGGSTTSVQLTDVESTSVARE